MDEDTQAEWPTARRTYPNVSDGVLSHGDYLVQTTLPPPAWVYATLGESLHICKFCRGIWSNRLRHFKDPRLRPWLGCHLRDEELLYVEK